MSSKPQGIYDVRVEFRRRISKLVEFVRFSHANTFPLTPAEMRTLTLGPMARVTKVVQPDTVEEANDVVRANISRTLTFAHVVSYSIGGSSDRTFWLRHEHPTVSPAMEGVTFTIPKCKYDDELVKWFDAAHDIDEKIDEAQRVTYRLSSIRWERICRALPKVAGLIDPDAKRFLNNLPVNEPEVNRLMQEVHNGGILYKPLYEDLILRGIMLERDTQPGSQWSDGLNVWIRS